MLTPGCCSINYVIVVICIDHSLMRYINAHTKLLRICEIIIYWHAASSVQQIYMMWVKIEININYS